MLSDETTIKSEVDFVLKYVKSIENRFKDDELAVICGYEAGPHRVLALQGPAEVPCVPASSWHLLPCPNPPITKGGRLTRSMLETWHFIWPTIPTRAVNVLSPEMESVKELTRVRASAAKAKKRAKQNLISFLLRKGMVYPFGGRAKYWTQQFFAWLRTLEFSNPLDRYCFEEYLTEANHQLGRVGPSGCKDC